MLDILLFMNFSCLLMQGIKKQKFLKPKSIILATWYITNILNRHLFHLHIPWDSSKLIVEELQNGAPLKLHLLSTEIEYDYIGIKIETKLIFQIKRINKPLVQHLYINKNIEMYSSRWLVICLKKFK